MHKVGLPAVTSEEDHIQHHIADTLKAGEYHHEKRHVKTLIKDGTEIMQNYLKDGLLLIGRSMENLL